MHCGLAGRANMDVIISDMMRRLDWKMDMLLGPLGVDDFSESCTASTVVVQIFKLRNSYGINFKHETFLFLSFLLPFSNFISLTFIQLIILLSHITIEVLPLNIC